MTDFFVVGLGLDVAGAILLAKGLLVSPRMIGVLAGQYWEFSPPDVIDRVRNRIDAEFGVAALAGGFLLQAVGYGFELAGYSAETGTGYWIVALLLALLATAGVFLAWRLARERRLMHILVRVAQDHEGSGNLGDEEDEVWTRRRVAILSDLGRAAGVEPIDEDYWGFVSGRSRYVRRVFGLEVPNYAQDDERDTPPNGSGTSGQSLG